MRDYRKDIDGLRAVAVLAVLGFHISDKYVPGGFVGVDVFFVISGFLITRIVWNQLNANEFSFATFYAKRIRRLYPALIAVLLVCGTIEFFWGLPGEAYDYGLSAISSVFYLSNHFFLSIDDYFSGSLEYNPLLHTWSLSIEEQFYLFYPALLLLIWRYNRKYIHFWIALLLVSSLAVSEYLYTISSSISFFIVPSRFWEFAIGGFIALKPVKESVPRKWMELLGWSGLIMLLYSFSMISSASHFPGIGALIPVAGTAMIIIAGQQGGLKISALLSNPVAHFFGKISYSLYLWHWPLIVFYNLVINPEPSDEEKIMLIFLSVLLGYLSWKFVEETTRKIDVIKNQAIIYRRGVLATAIVAMIGGFFVMTEGRKDRFSQQELSYISYLDYDTTDQFRSGSCFLTSHANMISQFDESECVNVDPQKPNVLILGDSHAAQYYEAFVQALPSVAFSQITASGCMPLIDARGLARCQNLMRRAFNEFIVANRFDVILLAGRWDTEHKEGILKTTEALVKLSSKVVVLGPIIEYNQALPRLFLRFGDEHSKILHADDYEDIRETDLLLDNAFENKAVQYYSVLEAICPNRLCKLKTGNGELMQFDTSHLTNSGAREIVGILMDQGLREDLLPAAGTSDSK